MIDTIKQFVFTPASVTRLEMDQYTFDVDKNATKTEIKNFFEKHYNIKVLRVNTYRPPLKTTRIGQYEGHSSSSKRAIITIKVEKDLQEKL
jgi:large subunit ribosomal protein L23